MTKTFTLETTAATLDSPLCRCRAGSAELTELGFAVMEREKSMGSWHVTRPGLELRKARELATLEGLVTVLCRCGASKRAQLEWMASH